MQSIKIEPLWVIHVHLLYGETIVSVPGALCVVSKFTKQNCFHHSMLGHERARWDVLEWRQATHY